MKSRYFYLIALAVLALDQSSKYLIASRLPVGCSLPVIGDAVRITIVRNPGGAFGLFQSWAALLTLVTIAAVVIITVLIRRRAGLPMLVGVALAFQLGGAAGNLIDRIRFGYVIDFIDLRVWPVFNIADSAITLGILLLAYYLLFYEGRQPAAEASERTVRD